MFASPMFLKSLLINFQVYLMTIHIFSVLCLFSKVTVFVHCAPMRRDGVKSEVTSYSGHWPESYCKVTNVMFNTGNKALSVNGDLDQLHKCFKTQDIWKFQPHSDTNELNDLVCDQTFSRGHFFTTYYYHGSNYFHLHYDTLIPLYMALQQQSSKSVMPKDVVLLPSVEAERGKGIDWETDAFMDPTSYWMEMLKVVSNSHGFLPLDSRLTGINKTICFKEAFFGTPKVNFTDPNLLHSFTSYVKKSFDVPQKQLDGGEKPKIALIHRSGRRKILNEEELKKSVENFVSLDLIDFSNLTVKEQILELQNYIALIGVNGAGLINALYLPETSVAVQLVPYKAHVNVEEFAELLKARGPYLEWHNTHFDHNHALSDDVFGNAPDTIIPTSEFVALVQRAIEEHNNYLKN